MEKNIIITGASSGLGKSLAEYLSKEYNVIIIGRNEEELRKTAEDNNCDYRVCDIADYKKVNTTIDDIVEKYKTIDVLINNAGLYIKGELDSNEEDLINSVIQVNVIGTTNITKKVIPIMKKQKEGLIININSQGSFQVAAERSVYFSSKWAITGLTKSLQLELSKYGIKVTGIYPGALDSTMKYKNVKEKRTKDVGVPNIEICKLVDYVINLPEKIYMPEIGIKHINN